MKISEGIRRGSIGKHQIKGQWYDSSDGVCAVGALMKLPNTSNNIYFDFPDLRKDVGDTFQSKDQCYIQGMLMSGIINRNESGWSFEQIVEWLESIGY